MEALQVSSPTMAASRHRTSSTEHTSLPSPQHHLDDLLQEFRLAFLNREGGGVQDRLVALSASNIPSEHTQGSILPYRNSQGHYSVKNETMSMSMRSTMASSMTQSHLNHRPESVISFDHSAPSLVSQVSTAANSSVKTDLASFIEGMPQLEDVGDGLLQIQEVVQPLPRLECNFSFLGCSYASYDEEEWKTHCLSHFFGEDPPRTVQCPFCDHFKGTYPDGHTAWAARMDHVKIHYSFGQTLKTARPDFGLFRHLWAKRLIDNADYKELSGGGGNHTLSKPFEQPYSVTNRQDHPWRNGTIRPRERRNRP